MAKYWSTDPDACTYGGVHLFEDEAADEWSRAIPEFAAVTTNPYFVDVQVRELSTIDQLDAVTAPGRATSSPV